MAAVTSDWVVHMVLQLLRSLSGWLRGTFSGPAAFADKSLSVGPSVHYRDETDISGLVAPGVHLITNNPPMVRRHPVGGRDREQVTLCMASGYFSPQPSAVLGR
jgi:hypothetical protein